MHKTIAIALVIVLTALAQAMPAQTDADASADGACVSWNLSYSNWQYRASAGGYGIMNLTQDAGGGLSGTWWNEAAQLGGLFTAGHIEGTSFGLHTDTNEWLQGTVSADGTRIGGTLQSPTDTGTWEATGVATCLQRQTPPPAGSAFVEISWGDYTFYTTIDPLTRLQSMAQQTQVTRISFGGRVVLVIRVRFNGQNLPPTITVVAQADGQPETTIATLTQVQSDDSGATYRGTATVPATGLAPGLSRTTRVSLVDPRNTGNRILIAVVNQFLIDPAGYIYDTSDSSMIPGAMATLYKKQGEDWIIWPAEQFGQMNPIVSDPDGHYAWDTDAGDFLVKVSKTGYTDGSGGPVTVPPEVTDLNIGLNPTTSAALEIGVLHVSDSDGFQKTEFLPGEGIQARVIVSNTTTSDAATTITWTTTDPQGELVPALSGSGTYQFGPFPVDPKIQLTIPPLLDEGWYTLRVEITHAGQTSFRGTQFWVTKVHLAFLPATPEGVANAPTPQPGWTTIMSENFEGNWPTAGWQSFDNSSSDAGEYRWAKRNCRAVEGNNSAWAVGGGADGSNLSCGSNYPDGVESWMTYGPFSLSGTTAAELVFQLWNNSESSYDVIFWGASDDGDNFNGWTLSGDTGGWTNKSLDLADVPNTGSLLGKENVWIAFIFDSDSSVNFSDGAHIDNIVLRKRANSTAQTGAVFTHGNFGAGDWELESATFKRE
jgi:hypothetical protein